MQLSLLAYFILLPNFFTLYSITIYEILENNIIKGITGNKFHQTISIVSIK
jgi:hypothetical protein